MPVFPRIDSPCPFAKDLASVVKGDYCRLCNRQVFDLTAMSDEERMAFLTGCESEVCVKYRLKVRPALAAAIAAAAFGAASPALAQDEEIIIIGGIKNPASAGTVEIPSASDVPEIPVVYESDSAGKPAERDASAKDDVSSASRA